MNLLLIEEWIIPLHSASNVFIPSNPFESDEELIAHDKHPAIPHTEDVAKMGLTI